MYLEEIWKNWHDTFLHNSSSFLRSTENFFRCLGPFFWGTSGHTELELQEEHSLPANRQHTTKEHLGNWKGKDEKREAPE
jgi:hypothetical protein